MNRTINPAVPFLHKPRAVLVCLLLVVVTSAAFYPLEEYDFVHFDDDRYVYENHHVKNGPTLESISWAFTTIHVGNWHPITWLSHMLDCRLYGLNSGKHHLTNLMIHVINVLLLYLILIRMTGAFWPSVLVAGLFALHPLHVESVAWISERKDVLSASFWMLTIWSYIRWIERPTVARYLLILFLFSLGLMSKPMVVTLPFVLILLDYWPLNRIPNKHYGGESLQKCRVVFRLIREKIPLFVLVAMSSAVTLYAQKNGGALAALDTLPFADRVANALISYTNYILKMIYPFHLAVLYPISGRLPWWKIVGSCLLLVSTTLLAVKARRNVPYFAVGWLWYVGTLVPVIGLVQVGGQAMADRYTYLPLVGIFIIIAWGLADLVERWRYLKIWLAALSMLLFSVLIVATHRQVKYWNNSIALFTHTLELTSDNWLPHNNLGNALSVKGQIDDAIRHFQEALRLNPNYEDAHYNLGNAFGSKGKTDDAIRHYREALRLNPNYVDAHNNLAVALARKGLTDDAIRHFREALRLKPNLEAAHNNLAVALTRKGLTDDAIEHYREALRLNPNHEKARKNLDNALRGRGMTGDAARHPKKPHPNK